MPDLSLKKQAQRLRIYISESDRWRGKPLDAALIETLRAKGMAGGTVFRGSAGFGAHSRIHSAAIETLAIDLPLVIEAIDTPEKIAAVLEVIYPMVREGLITLEDVQIVKYTHRFLNPLPVDKLVSEVMTHPVISLAPDTPIHQVWKILLEQRVKAAPVIDAERKVLGILTDEDLLERAGIQQRLSVAIRMDAGEIEQEIQTLKSSTLTAADVMTRPVVTVLQSETLGTATEQMVKAGLKRLPVVDGQGRLTGMLSRLDILRQAANSPLLAQIAQLRPGTVRTVRDIMDVNIPAVGQDDDLATMIEKFSQCDEHRLIVIDTDGKAVGLLSDSDIVARIQPQKRRGILAALRRVGKPPTGTETALELMSPGPLTAGPDLPVLEAARMMLAQSRKWLVVIDDLGKPLGLVDRRILLESLTVLQSND